MRFTVGISPQAGQDLEDIVPNFCAIIGISVPSSFSLQSFDRPEATTSLVICPHFSWS
jgi:hypothetical protein